MRSRIALIAARIPVNLGQSGTDVQVVWTQVTGGVVDPGTGATVGGTEVMLSGVMPAFGDVTSAASTVRQWQEIQAGDLILDAASDPVVTLYPGQAVTGTVRLDDLDSPRFLWHDQWYAAQKVGEDLRTVWDAQFANVKLYKRIWLRSL